MSEREPESMALAAFTSCGCLVAATVDRVERFIENAQHVKDWQREGLTVERVTCDRVRAELRRCKHKVEVSA